LAWLKTWAFPAPKPRKSLNPLPGVFGIKRYMDDSINQAREQEYVETILGRRPYLRDINSRNITTRGFAGGMRSMHPFKGSAADIIKIAMINIIAGCKRKTENQNDPAGTR